MSTPGDCGSDDLKVVEFQSSFCGQMVGQANGTAPLNSRIWINGSANLRGCIVGPNGAFVEKITFEHHSGPVRNAEVNVYGAGPKGMGSGTLNLQFHTDTGATHTLGLTSSTPQCHADIFQELGNITSIQWSSD
jgi:hypothetical protein